MAVIQKRIATKLVSSAYLRIAQHIIESPLINKTSLSRIVTRSIFQNKDEAAHCFPVTLHFKCENLQKTGSFKYRGILHRLLKLFPAEVENGVATTSSGNHAAALASAAGDLSRRWHRPIPVYAVMPHSALPHKVDRATKAGAQVIRCGDDWNERSQTLDNLCKLRGLVKISAGEDPDVIAGQGTAAYEMVQQMSRNSNRQLDCLITPCGTGSLLAGSGLALASLPISVFGSEPRNGADDGVRGLRDGYRISDVTSDTVADGLRCPIGPLAWNIIKDKSFIEGIFSVEDSDIFEAVKLIQAHLGMIVEPSAAVPLAVVLRNQAFHTYVKDSKRGLDIGVVLTGGNVC